MKVYVSNNRAGRMHYLAGKYPGRIGHLYSPKGYARPPRYMEFALDNGGFNGFAALPFRAMLEKARLLAPRRPDFVTVPDEYANRERTLELWAAWFPELAPLDWPLAFVVQNGMTAKDVPTQAAVVFVGGTPTWKLRTLETWTRLFPVVHVGRINTERLLWICHDLQVASVDGTGWFHDAQFADLERYLEAASGLRHRDEQMLLHA